MERYAIAEHAWTEHHHPQWDDISILDHARDTTTLLIKEALHIRLTGHHCLINRDQGIAIGDIRKTFLKYTKHH